MKIKDLQNRLDYLIEYVKKNPNTEISSLLISVRGFSMRFKYLYNEIYGIHQLKIRLHNHLNERIIFYDYIPKNIDSIDAYALYTTFIAYVENQLYGFQDDLLNQLRSGAVELNRSEIK